MDKHRESNNLFFNSLCLSMYGLQVFMSKRNCVSDLKKLGVAYHFAVKRLLGLPKYFSNHYACGLLNRFTFEHLMNFRAFRFFFWLSKCASPCFSRYKTYFLNKSILSKYVNQVFVDKYSVTRIIDDDIMIRLSLGFCMYKARNTLVFMVLLPRIFRLSCSWVYDMFLSPVFSSVSFIFCICLLRWNKLLLFTKFWNVLLKHTTGLLQICFIQHRVSTSLGFRPWTGNTLSFSGLLFPCASSECRNDFNEDNTLNILNNGNAIRIWDPQNLL